MSDQDQDVAWSEIGREGELVLRDVHENVLAVAAEYDAHCKAHPEKATMLYMAPLVAYTRDALRGVFGAWQHQSLVGVTSIARSLFEAVLIVQDIAKEPALAQRFLRYGHVATLLDCAKDSTVTPEKRQKAFDEIERGYPEWCRRDPATGKVIGYRGTWRADDKRIDVVAREHGWKDAYDMVYRDCSAYVHPTSLLGVLSAHRESPHVLGLLVQRAHFAALFGQGAVVGLAETFGMEPKQAPVLTRLVERFEQLYTRSLALQGLSDEEDGALAQSPTAG